jgi:hypothetical protein
MAPVNDPDGSSVSAHQIGGVCGYVSCGKKKYSVNSVSSYYVLDLMNCIQPTIFC